ncbi:MAG: phage holin family protein [Burkholderiales bacterium]|nr:phage holin family protein [Burkholderiales bacterium]
MAAAAPVALPRRLLANLLALVTARLALAQLEIRESAGLALQRLGWLLAMAACGGFALQFGLLYLLLSYGGDTRLWMVAGFALTFLCLTLIVVVASVRMARTSQPLCALTRSEWADDLDAFRSDHDSR